MIVCLCKVVTNHDIESAIGQGAHSLDHVGQRCGAGTGCGACHEYIEAMIERARANCPGTGCQGCELGTREAA